MQFYTNNITNPAGTALAGLSVRVQNQDGSTATIYSDNGITPATNPLTTDGTGSFGFYAANGRYQLAISGNGITPYTVKDILLNDPTQVFTNDIDMENLANTANGYGADLIANAAKKVASIAALRALRVPQGSDAQTVIVDGVDKPVIWNATSMAPDNGGTVIMPNSLGSNQPGRWLLQFNGTVGVKVFGAVPGGTVDASAAIQAAINSGVRRVVIGDDFLVGVPLNFAPNQIIDFAGGSLIASAGINAPNGILYSNAKVNIKIIDPVIDASATPGVTGINLQDSTGSRIIDGHLTKCCIELGASSNSNRMGYKVSDTVIDMAGWQSTSVFVSNVFKASLSSVECFNGIEGIGIYNACRHIKQNRCESYGHARDGFVVIDGQKISYSDCFSYSNGQSGFTTQRLSAGSQAQFITYSGCHAHDNTADGFDLRGHGDPGSYGVNMFITADACQSYNNNNTGFYIVNAEGTTLTGCVAASNNLQGFFGNNSVRTLLVGCRSVSNANGIATGNVNKAGIFLQDCTNSGLVGCDSENSNGATQDYGLSLTGASTDCFVTGGNYLNNNIAPASLNTGDAGAFVAGAAIQSIGNVWTDTITAHTGVYLESGFGAPTHTRPKASIFRRVDSGGNGEVYASNGNGTWYLI